MQQDIQQEITNNKIIDRHSDKTIADIHSYVYATRYCRQAAHLQLGESVNQPKRKAKSKKYEHLMIIFGARKQRLAEILGSADNVRRLPVHITLSN